MTHTTAALLLVIAILFIYAIFVTELCFKFSTSLKNYRKKYEETIKLHNMYKKVSEESEKILMSKTQ